MADLVDIGIGELNGKALNYATGELAERIGRPILFCGTNEMIKSNQKSFLRRYTEGDTVRVPRCLVEGE